MARKAKNSTLQSDVNWTLWPRYESHDEVSCYNCGSDLGPDPYWRPSRHPAGHGAFEVECEKCRLRTYYDIVE